MTFLLVLGCFFILTRRMLDIGMVTSKQFILGRWVSSSGNML